MNERLNEGDVSRVETLHAKCAEIRRELAKRVVGQEEMVDQVLTAVFARGHALLTGVPGLAKTLLVRTLAEVMDLGFGRIQFTPDLMPADVTGTEVLDEDRATGRHVFRFVKGPVFTNLLLADEINRTPPKTQAALLEAMQEHCVTVGGETRPLPEPFFVLATQNPIEQEGTYPLPEAQLDRFFFNIKVDYPSRAEECEIIRQTTGEDGAAPAKVLSAAEIVELQSVVRRVPAADHVVEYAADLVRATRPKTPDAPEFVKELVSWGAGPRAGMALVTAAKARAVLNGRAYATTADVKWAALPVMRHRIATTFNAAGYMKWLPDAALGKLARIEFLAHGAVDGFIAGRHKSARKGASAEFAEHRAYVAGDDPRTLDWRLAARRQRLYVKQYVDETNLRATIVLDASGSMGYRGRAAAGGLSKLEYGQYVAASLAYLLVNQQDAVGFASYDTAVRDFVPAKAEPSQVRCILERLDALKPGGETDMAGVLHEIAERIPRRSVVFVVSDFFADAKELLRALHHLRFRRHEVIAIQVCDHDELTFPFERACRFEDLETRQFIDVDARALRKDYLARLGAHFAELSRGCGEMRVTHERVDTSRPFHEALADILVRYRRAAGGGR